MVGRRRRPSCPIRPTSPTPAEREAVERALHYMALEPGTPIAGDPASTGSSSARARTRASRICAPRPRSSTGSRSRRRVRAMVVPGSATGEAPGRGRRASTACSQRAGFEWREAGCSMCLGMNPDILAPGERCASTSNRNFEGRQGAGGRTHLVSPGDGRRRRGRGPLHRRAGAARMRALQRGHGAGRDPRSPRRRHRPDHPEAVPEAHRALGLRRVPLLRLDEGSRLRAAQAETPGARSWSPAATSAAARRASTPRGRSRTTGSGSCWRRSSATSSARTRSRRASRRLSSRTTISHGSARRSSRAERADGRPRARSRSSTRTA